MACRILQQINNSDMYQLHRRETETKIGKNKKENTVELMTETLLVNNGLPAMRYQGSLGVLFHTRKAR